MAANISKIQLSDTFNTWVERSNSVIDKVNSIENTDFRKDLGILTANGSIVVTTNGTLTLQKTGAVGLVVQGSAQIQESLTVGGIGNVALAIANAASTTNVSANSGSTRIANTLNFINTSTVTVSVGAGIGTGANIAFNVVGGTAQGIQGTQGIQGRQGIQGTSGTGIQGTQGISGSVASQGVQGVQGITGSTGSTGATGTQGVQGTTGSTGATGTQGVQGLQGTFGPSTVPSSASTTLVASDSGKCVVTAAGTVTINNSVFSVGNIVSIFNNSASSATLTGSLTTLYVAGTALTGFPRTLGSRGICTLWFIDASTAVISGSGLS